MPLTIAGDDATTQFAEPAIQISEMFGPTIQGEGIDIGRPALFVRLHNCPVHCPGCDTYYTWDGSEKGTRITLEEVKTFVQKKVAVWPNVGLVLTGGEPLIHYKNEALRNLLRGELRDLLTFRSIETSGYCGTPLDKINREPFYRFLESFDTIHCSPKITPCLHGKQTDEELLELQELFESYAEGPQLIYKFVARDQADVKAVLKWDAKYNWLSKYPVYLMPYGTERDEILRTIETLIPACAKYGFCISPRLHSILWGKERLR